MIYVILSYLISPVIFILTALRRRKAVSNILVIQTAKIGDMICSTPVFREIKKKFPDARITALTSPVTKKLLEKNPNVDEIITIKDSEYRGIFGRLRLAGLMRRGNYDAAVCLNPNTPFAIALFLGLIPVRISIMPDLCGLTFRMASLLFSRLQKHTRGEMVLETYLKMLGHIGIEASDRTKEVYWPETAEKKVDEILGSRDRSLIGIGVSSGNKMKELGSEKLAKLSNKIFESTDAVIVLIGSGSEREASEDIISSVNNKERLINATGLLGLDELPALIKRLSLFIGVDSGITFMADAISIQLIDIAGPSDMDDQRPTGEDALILQKGLPCIPCSHSFRSPYSCRLGTRECITSVAIEEIMPLVSRLLKKGI